MNFKLKPTEVAGTTRNKYVAFCDILGFSAAVENRFEETVYIYKDFMNEMGRFVAVDNVEVSIYSDSILLVSDDLHALISAIKSLLWSALRHDLMIRGGVAYGKYWESRDGGHLLVVSDALVRAVKLESTISHPAVGFSPEVKLDLGLWAYRFENDLFSSPLLHIDELTIVNPFNKYWFKETLHKSTQLGLPR